MLAPVTSKIRSPKQAGQRDEGEVVDVGRVAACGEHGFELQVAQTQRRRLPWHVRASNVVGRGALEDAVDARLRELGW